MEVYSSKHGIGAVLLQEGRPVEYASRALTPSERNWAQIEKEALSVLFGPERFDQCTYGRPVKVDNDHKPLAAILRKPLSQAPKRLQDIMMRYHRYDVHFVFVKGTDLLIADTLSRAHQRRLWKGPRRSRSNHECQCVWWHPRQAIWWDTWSDLVWC